MEEGITQEKGKKQKSSNASTIFKPKRTFFFPYEKANKGTYLEEQGMAQVSHNHNEVKYMNTR